MKKKRVADPKMQMKRHEVNPFMDEMDIKIGSKSVHISTLGADDNILVNQATGEIKGTHIVTRKKVDSSKFLKTFADHMAFTFDLTAAGIKALNVLMWATKEYAIGKDQVDLGKYTMEEFLAAYNSEFDPPLKLSYPTYNRGLSELQKAKLIAKTMRTGRYFINPQCIFNGDRIAFSTVLERKTEEEQQELPLE